jgi:hypothetical protein
VSQEPVNLVAIYTDALFKLKAKENKPGSVKKSFPYLNIKLVEITEETVVIHIIVRDPETGRLIQQMAEIAVEDPQVIEQMYLKF